MNKQQLASKIWEAANRMRSKIEANEYKDYILGFIFYKFLSENQERYLRSQEWADEDLQALTEEDPETVQYVQRNVGYFIAYKNLFSTWIAMGKDFDESNVRDALSAFGRLIHASHARVFKDIFNTLETGLSKLGESASSRTKAISDLIHLIDEIPMDGRQGYDVLGYIYEYLISMFASNAGKKAGEFYTPHEVSELMSEIVAHHLQGKDEIKIYDPTSGSGSLLITIGKAVARRTGSPDAIKYYAQELKVNTFNLTRMNLVMRGINPSNIAVRNGDTLEEDWPWFDDSDPAGTYEPLYVDAVVSNPPYSQRWEPEGKESDPRYAYGLAPKSKADYAFLLHDLYHLRPEGVMTIVLPHGVLFRGGEEGAIRKNLVEHGNIEAIIGLPANIFFGTGIPTIVMVLRQKPQYEGILVVDASKGFVKDGKNNKLRACDIKRIVDAVETRCNVEKFCRVVSIDEVRANDYNLNIPRYVDSSEQAEEWDIYATMFGGIPQSEIDTLQTYWDALPGLRDSLFTDTGGPYATLAVQDPRSAICSHASVQAFRSAYAGALADFGPQLTARLIESYETIEVPSEEPRLASDIFQRLAGVPLVDRYDAYQALDNEWQTVAIDLEVLQSEGFDAVRQVDPRYVLKKKNGVDTEVQDGWVGRLIPFELAQRELFAAELADVSRAEQRLAAISGEIDELFEGLSEEDKAALGEAVDEEGFVAAEVSKRVKELKRDIKRGKKIEEAEQSLIAYDELVAEEKSLKKKLKDLQAALHAKTKAAIESLSDDRAKRLLEKKWLAPLLSALEALPQTVIDDLAKKVEALASKYQTTYSDLVAQRHEAERELASMLGNLTGSEHDMLGISAFRSMLVGE